MQELWGKLHGQHYSCRLSVAAAVAPWVLQRVLQLTAAHPRPVTNLGAMGCCISNAPGAALMLQQLQLFTLQSMCCTCAAADRSQPPRWQSSGCGGAAAAPRQVCCSCCSHCRAVVCGLQLTAANPRPVTNAGAMGVLCQRHFSCRPCVAPVPVMGSGCVVVHVHGAGLARSVHCSGCGRWSAALLVCTHPRCR